MDTGQSNGDCALLWTLERGVLDGMDRVLRELEPMDTGQWDGDCALLELITVPSYGTL